jgi:hypothetical protein
MRSRVLRGTVLGIVSASAALTLTACGATGSGTTSSAATASAVSGGSSTSGDDSGPGQNTPAANGTTGGSTGGSTGGGKQDAAAGGTRCHTPGLALSFGPGDGKISSSDDQQHLQVELRNTTSRTCVMKGFPGVDLRAGGQTWSLTRSSAAVRQVSVAPGGHADFTITFLPWTEDSGTEFKATKLVVTPPDETTQLTAAWPGGSVLLQDGATHPGTYTGPIGG